ncbi:MAG: LPS export ABC transporter periplasmic protein LptC [Alphaproteobacteria bacterium]|nr:MAG: LPS export ABC transporter periplasmic protein LptC [Alphaproteobacteria bacterium]
MTVTTGYLDGAPGRHATFASAQRHSRMVAILRKALPFVGVAALLAFVVVARLSAPGRPDFTVARTTIERNTIVMDRPVLTGYDTDNREYRVSADRAIQKMAAPNQVRLEEIRAEVTIRGRDGVVITAKGGDYDHSRGTLALYGGLTVDSDDGIRVRMKNADIDFANRTLTTKNPVSILNQDSETTADAMTVTDGGNVIVLSGRVQTRLMSPKRKSASPSSSGPLKGQPVTSGP